MISVYSVKKALLDKAVEVSTANSYVLVPNGMAYTPTPNEAYVKEFTITGEDNNPFLADDSCDTQRGIYQLTIFTPKAMAGGKWLGSSMSDIYKAAFPKGLFLTHESQRVRIVKSASITNDNLDTNTHYTTILSITYNVIN